MWERAPRLWVGMRWWGTTTWEYPCHFTDHPPVTLSWCFCFCFSSKCLSSSSVSHPLPLPPSPPRQYRSTGTQCPSACDVDCSPVHLRQSRLCRALFPSPPFPWSGLAELSCASVRFLCVGAEPALYGDPVRTRRACTHARLRQLVLDGTDPTHSVDRTSLTLSGAAAASFLHCSGSWSLAGQPTRGKLG